MTNLSRLRKEKALSQAELAKKAEINKRTLQQYEQGARDINKAGAITVYRLSKALGCDMTEILEIKKSKKVKIILSKKENG